MDFFINTSGPIALIILGLVIGAIFFGKRIHKPIMPILVLALNLALLVMHSIYLQGDIEDTVILSRVYRSMAFDFAFVLVSFIGYLWVDDADAKITKKKSYDDTLSWFWEKL